MLTYEFSFDAPKLLPVIVSISSGDAIGGFIDVIIGFFVFFFPTKKDTKTAIATQVKKETKRIIGFVFNNRLYDDNGFTFRCLFQRKELVTKNE